MPIPAAHQHRCLFHFSHIENLNSLLASGFIAKNHPAFPTHVRSVAAESIQERRSSMQVPFGPGGVMHNYVPLYFGTLSPMLLAVINAKNVDQRDILYFEFPIALIARADTVFTDAAANANDLPNFYHDPGDLVRLDWPLIDSLSWGEKDPARKRRRMAEALVHWELPLASALRCVVLDDAARTRVASLVAGAPFPPIELERHPRYHFYRKFWSKDESLLKGPGEVSAIFGAALTRTEAALGKSGSNASFPDLDGLLAALRQDYQCLPYTSELIGLQSANAVHSETVDVHTREVVGMLQSLPEFQALPADQQRDVELAAHLHDIGKGPKSRWPKGKQEVDADHPVAAMPMMEDILANRVRMVPRESARRLMKLVCYHDLVGDVLGKGRDRQQIIDLCEDEAELDMIFALGRADASVLREVWGNELAWRNLHGACAAALARK